MSRDFKKLFLGALCFAYLNSHCFSLPSKRTLMDYGVKIASAGVILKTIHHFSKLYVIDTTSLDHFITQLRYHKYRAERFLEDYDTAYRQHGLLDSAILAQYSGYPYPAITYYTNLTTLIGDLTKLQSAFERKKSQTKDAAQWSKIDHCIQVITILKVQLETLKDLVPHSEVYKMEKAVRKWPIKTAVFGTTAGFLAGAFGLMFTMKIGAMPSDFYDLVLPRR